LSPGNSRRHTPCASLAHGVCGLPCSGVHLTVKRVVGLPGETIAVRHGDLYVDGRIEQKSLDQLRAMAILVHDDAFRPQPAAGVAPRAPLAERWRSEVADSGWRRHAGRLQYRPVSDRDGNYDWLGYHHWRCFASPLPRTAPSPVLDNDGFNQGESRQLQAVAELLLVCVLRTGGPAGSLALEIDDGSHGYRAELFPEERRGRLLCQGTVVADFPLPAAAFAQGVLIEWATCDGRVLLAVDRRVVLVHQCAPAQGGREPSPTPLAIGVRSFPVEIRRLQVWRDVYYLDPPGLGRDWETPRRLGPGEYCLLGDNAAVSQDSRHWPAFAVPRRSVSGQVWR
jgi:signal peptidase I